MRPATAAAPDGTPTTCDWLGRFSDDTRIGGRLVPTRGEVGYIRDGRCTPFWRGEVTSWKVE